MRGFNSLKPQPDDPPYEPSEFAGFELHEAHRAGARVVIVLAGGTGDGKTYTALQLAYGMANFDSSKIAVLDTENNRALLYSDQLKDAGGRVVRFRHANFIPPHSPERYITWLSAIEKQGVEVLVIDSGSHEWEGIGGCEDIAEAGVPANKPKRWDKAKRAHKQFMAKLLTCEMHVIVCLRAREKVKKDGDKYISQGIQPVCEKNFMFEATASLLMLDGGRSQRLIKVPNELMGILGREKGYITSADGAAIRAWVDGAATPAEHRVETYRHRLISATVHGTAKIREAWSKVDPEMQAALGENFLAMLLASAAGHDQLAKQETTNAERLDAAIDDGGGNE